MKFLIFFLLFSHLVCAQRKCIFYSQNDSVQIFDYKIQILKADQTTEYYPNEKGEVELKETYEENEYIYILNKENYLLNITSTLKTNRTNNTLYIEDFSVPLADVVFTTKPEFKKIGADFNGGIKHSYLTNAYMVNGVKIDSALIWKKIFRINIKLVNRFGFSGMYEKVKIVLFQSDTIPFSQPKILLEKEFLVPNISKYREWISFNISKENIHIEKGKYIFYGLLAPTFLSTKIKKINNDSIVSCSRTVGDEKINISDDINNYWYCSNNIFDMNFEVIKSSTE